MRNRGAYRSAWLSGCVLCGLVLPGPGVAQEPGRLVGLVVTSNQGLPIPGALVALDAGLRTDADGDGAFTLDGVREGPYRIAAIAPGCHIGYGEVEVVSGREIRVRMAVALPDDAEDRLGRWTLGTRSLGESVKSLTGEQMRKRHLQSIQDALRIIAPDMVGGESAQIGGRQLLRNRGAPTDTGGAEPLVILDGIPIPQRSLDALAGLNMEDVELIEVMRGGAGTWRYGTQGVNGVLRITTRDATSGYAAATPARECAFSFPR